MSKPVRLRCDMPGGYHGSRPGVSALVRHGEVVEVPSETADYLCSTFGAYWDRMETPAKALPAAPVGADLHWRTLVAGIASGEFDDALPALCADQRRAVRKAAARRVDEIRG